MGILFCNVGWMERYQGQTAADEVTGGGSFVEDHGTGHEVCNFAPHDGIVYGYVQAPHGASQYDDGAINIDRIGAQGAASVAGVLVVWTANREGAGTVVVGWYQSARVFRYYQKFERVPALHGANGLDGYRIEAAASGAVCLPVDERTLPIPRKIQGGMGQSNIWYADQPGGEATVRAVHALVEGTARPRRRAARGERATDPAHRARVEAAAVALVWQHYEDMGYAMKSVEQDNVGWDLEAKAERVRLTIEVKGLSGSACRVELTPNETRAMRSRAMDYRLAIVTGALTRPTLRVCRFDPERGDWRVDGDEALRVEIETVASDVVRVTE